MAGGVAGALPQASVGGAAWLAGGLRGPRGAARDSCPRHAPRRPAPPPPAPLAVRLPSACGVERCGGSWLWAERGGAAGRRAGRMRVWAALWLAQKAPPLPRHYRYGMNRPGSMADKLRNPPGQRRKPVPVEPIDDSRWHVFQGDTVSPAPPRPLPPGSPPRPPP